MIIGSKLFFYKVLTSTNTHAARLIRISDLPEGTIVYTNYQSAGKGQKGNTWESENGKNLLISIILFPGMIPPEEQFLISMAMSLGICYFLKRYISQCKIKWPNDIYVNDDKIAGILIENSIMGSSIENSIVGIGLNINQVKFLSDAPNPVSLSMLTGKSYNLSTCLTQLTVDLDNEYKKLLSGKRDLIRREYISLLYHYNDWYNYKDSNGIFSGRLLSVTFSGLLQIENRQGIINEFSFKELEFMP